MTDSPWLTPDQLAERLQMSPLTIAHWRQHQKGPKYARFGIHVRYRLSDVEAWEQSQIRGEGGAA